MYPAMALRSSSFWGVITPTLVLVDVVLWVSSDFHVVEDADVLCCSRVTRVLVDVGVSVFVTVVVLVDVVVDAAKALVDIAANTHATNKDFLLSFINLSSYYSKVYTYKKYINNY